MSMRERLLLEATCALRGESPTCRRLSARKKSNKGIRLAISQYPFGPDSSELISILVSFRVLERIVLQDIGGDRNRRVEFGVLPRPIKLVRLWMM